MQHLHLSISSSEMLPFSGIWFFYWVLLSALLVHATKLIFPQIRDVARRAVMGVSVLYLLFIFPDTKPLLYFICWVMLWLFLSIRYLRLKGVAWFIIPLLLPLLLSRIGETASIFYFTGLSYISFRALQVFLDREQIASEWNISDLLFFLVYPPAILMGPIDRYRNFRNNLHHCAELTNGDSLIRGIIFCFQGAALKFIFAEMVNMFWLSAYEAQPTVFFAGEMYAYSIFLYFDFAGYSLMAMGWSLLCGMPLPENFNLPFLSENIQDFWRRFHISLGDWLKDYFFKPIYKFLSSQSSFRSYPLLRQNLALFLTFLLMGCWNGFRLPFIVSGALFGLYSVLHNTWVVVQRRRNKVFFLSGDSPVERILSVLLTLHAACFSLYIFGGHSPWFK